MFEDLDLIFTSPRKDRECRDDLWDAVIVFYSSETENLFPEVEVEEW